MNVERERGIQSARPDLIVKHEAACNSSLIEFGLTSIEQKKRLPHNDRTHTPRHGIPRIDYIRECVPVVSSYRSTYWSLLKAS